MIIDSSIDVGFLSCTVTLGKMIAEVLILGFEKQKFHIYMLRYEVYFDSYHDSNSVLLLWIELLNKIPYLSCDADNINV